MNSYLITLTSNQTLGNPDLLNHYLFTDPIFGLNFVYPLTADGGAIYPFTFQTIASGGLFFPWGYLLATTYSSFNIGPLKGPYTVTFSPSGLDTSFYAILKIVYDFGDGTTEVIERDVVPNNPNTNLLESGNPASINISHIYYPRDRYLTTYYPSVTVLNGNLSLDIFSYKIDIVPASVYELGDIRLINTAQHVQSLDETLAVFEVERPNEYVTNARFFSASDAIYNADTPVFDFLNTPDLILNLDASDALKIYKNSNNYVSYWVDKTVYRNDFTQNYVNHRPVYKNENQAQSLRKSVNFKNLTLATTDTQFMTCVKTTGFSSISSGYSLCLVMKGNLLGGTIFGFTSGFTPATPYDVDVSQVLMYNRALSQDEIETVKSGLRVKWNIPQ